GVEIKPGGEKRCDGHHAEGDCRASRGTEKNADRGRGRAGTKVRVGDHLPIAARDAARVLGPPHGIASPTRPPRSDAEELLECPSGRGDRLRVGALLVLVLGRGEAVAGAAVNLQLEGNLAPRSSCTTLSTTGSGKPWSSAPCRIRYMPLAFLAQPACWSRNEPWIETL